MVSLSQRMRKNLSTIILSSKTFRNLTQSPKRTTVILNTSKIKVTKRHLLSSSPQSIYSSSISRLLNNKVTMRRPTSTWWLMRNLSLWMTPLLTKKCKIISPDSLNLCKCPLCSSKWTPTWWWDPISSNNNTTSSISNNTLSCTTKIAWHQVMVLWEGSVNLWWTNNSHIK